MAGLVPRGRSSGRGSTRVSARERPWAAAPAPHHDRGPLDEAPAAVALPTDGGADDLAELVDAGRVADGVALGHAEVGDLVAVLRGLPGDRLAAGEAVDELGGIAGRAHHEAVVVAGEGEGVAESRRGLQVLGHPQPRHVLPPRDRTEEREAAGAHEGVADRRAPPAEAVRLAAGEVVERGERLHLVSVVRPLPENGLAGRLGTGAGGHAHEIAVVVDVPRPAGGVAVQRADVDGELCVASGGQANEPRSEGHSHERAGHPSSCDSPHREGARGPRN